MRRGFVLRRIFFARMIHPKWSNPQHQFKPAARMLRPQSSAGGMQDGSSHSGVESRAAARTNLFLAATLISSGAGHPVKIRDLSAPARGSKLRWPWKSGPR